MIYKDSVILMLCALVPSLHYTVTHMRPVILKGDHASACKLARYDTACVEATPLHGNNALLHPFLSQSPSHQSSGLTLSNTS